MHNRPSIQYITHTGQPALGNIFNSFDGYINKNIWIKTFNRFYRKQKGVLKHPFAPTPATLSHFLFKANAVIYRRTDNK